MENVQQDRGEVYITATGSFLPNEPVDNENIEEVLGVIGRPGAAVKRRVLMNNGIMSRHYAIHPATHAFTHSNVDMTIEAIRALFDSPTRNIEAVQCLACGTSMSDQLVPSHASMVHGALSGPACEVVATSGVCCAGMTALKYGFLNVKSGLAANAVATGSEFASPLLRAKHFSGELKYQDQELQQQPSLAFSDQFLRWMLSDGAGAVWMDRKPNDDRISLLVDWVDIYSFANQSPVCMYSGLRPTDEAEYQSYRTIDNRQRVIDEGYLNLGQDVRVLQEKLPVLMSESIERTIQRREMVAEKIDWLLPHYSSKWFRQQLFDGLGALGFEIPYERWFTNLATKGNTGSASIYIMLDELMRSGHVQAGHRLLCLVPESARMTFALMHLTAV